MAVTHLQPHNQRSELSSRTRRRGLPGSGGGSSSAMNPPMDESLKTLAESADCAFQPRRKRSDRAAFCLWSGWAIGGVSQLPEEPKLDQMPARKSLVIVLAAGEGTRMRSHVSKVLHQLGGRSLLGHVLIAARAGGTDELAVVVGPDHDAVSAEARRYAPDVQLFEQRERSGTAHAVLMARKAIEVGVDDVLVMFGDTPLVRAETLLNLQASLADGADVAVLGFKPADPRGYGRLVMQRRELIAIREERDATAEERKIALCNGGLMAIAGKHALAILSSIGNANAKREYYLTDAVAVARDMGLKAVAIETSEDDVRGINTKVQ